MSALAQTVSLAAALWLVAVLLYALLSAATSAARARRTMAGRPIREWVQCAFGAKTGDGLPAPARAALCARDAVAAFFVQLVGGLLMPFVALLAVVGEVALRVTGN